MFVPFLATPVGHIRARPTQVSRLKWIPILTTNNKMIRLAKSAATKVSIERSGDTYEVVMIF